MRISDWSSDVCSSDLLGTAFERQPELIREAAEGRSQSAVQAMNKEAEVRIDPFQRADRFVEGWQQLQRQREELVRDGDLRGAKRVTQSMAGMAKSLERDAQLKLGRGGTTRDRGRTPTRSHARRTP